MDYLQWLIYTMLDSTRLLNAQKLTATSTAGSVKSLKWFLKNETSYNLKYEKIIKTDGFSHERGKRNGHQHTGALVSDPIFILFSLFSH